MASFARLIRATRGPWGNMRVSFRIYKRSVLKACETNGVYCSLCAMLSETYSSVGTCFFFFCFFFFTKKGKKPLVLLWSWAQTSLRMPVHVFHFRYVGGDRGGSVLHSWPKIACCCFTGEIAGFYHGRACAARDLNSRRWKKEEKGIMSLETTKKSQRFPTLGKK